MENNKLNDKRGKEKLNQHSKSCELSEISSKMFCIIQPVCWSFILFDGLIHYFKLRYDGNINSPNLFFKSLRARGIFLKFLWEIFSTRFLLLMLSIIVKRLKACFRYCQLLFVVCVFLQLFSKCCQQIYKLFINYLRQKKQLNVSCN